MQQTISAQEFLSGSPVSTAGPAQPDNLVQQTRNRFTEDQYRDYVRLVRNRNTSPEQLSNWMKDQGIGGATNAAQILDFVRRNPRAEIPNEWREETLAPEQDIIIPEYRGDVEPSPTAASEELTLSEAFTRGRDYALEGQDRGLDNDLKEFLNPITQGPIPLVNTLNQGLIGLADAGAYVGEEIGAAGMGALRAGAELARRTGLIDDADRAAGEIADIATIAGVSAPIGASPVAPRRVRGGRRTEVTPTEVPETPSVRAASGELETAGAASASTESVVTRMTDALNNAGKATIEQERLYSEARRERLAKARAIRETTPGEAGFRAELAQLKGELPRAEFEPVRPQFEQTEIDELFNIVKNNPNLQGFESIRAQGALSNLLEGKTPARNEIELLRRVFPSDFMRAVAKHRSGRDKLSDFISNAVNLPRTLMSSMEMSAPLRQGIFLVGRKEFYQSLPTMFKEFARGFKENDSLPETKKGSNWQPSGSAVIDEIRQRPTYDLMDRSGLALTSGRRDNLSKREEDFMSSWGERIPVIGRGVKASEAAYTGFLNKLRADVFDDLVRLHKEAGINLELEPTVLKDISKFINSATGRGDLPANLNKAADLLNGAFFSPRLIKSRLDLLNPYRYATYSPIVRKEAIKSLLSFSAIAGTVLSLATLAGLEVGTDPRSSDFGKIVDGNTRYDILGGFSQYLTLGARLLTNETTTTKGKTRTLGEGYGSRTRQDVVEDFLLNKLAPVPSFVNDALRGKDAIGTPFEVDDAVLQRVVPMFWQDYIDLVQEEGIKGAITGSPGFFGVGINTHTPTLNRTEFQNAGSSPTETDTEETAPLTTDSPPLELTVEQFVEGEEATIPEDFDYPDLPRPSENTFENSIASQVLYDLGLRITDNGVRSDEDQAQYHQQDPQGVPPPGGSDHNYGNAVDVAVPTDGTSVEEIVEALTNAGFTGVHVVTRKHGTGPHWHISWEGTT